MSNFGPEESLLCDRFAGYFGVARDRIATASNATLALAGSLAVADSRRWLLPSFTFTASAAAAKLATDEFVFGDIGPDWWLNGSGSSHAKLFVAPFGSALQNEVIAGDGEVVVDAAASVGGSWNLMHLRDQVTVVFSLHATKVLGAGEGAIVVFGSAERAQRFRMWTNFGFFGSRESQFVGVNAKMSEIQAAYVHAALDGWDEERAEWSAARDLVVRVGDEVGLRTFDASRNCVTPYWITVYPDAATTDLVERVLAEHGIGTRRWWSRGCHRMPAYADVPHGPLPVTEDVADRYLGLPMYRGLGEREAELILSALEVARERAEVWG